MTSQLGPFSPRAEIEPPARASISIAIRSCSGDDGCLGAVRLDFGDSFLYNRPVGPLVVRAAGNTAVLAVAALMISTLVGIGLGIFTGSRRTGWLSALVRGASVMFISCRRC